MALDFEERLRIEENYDVYDLVEALDLTIGDLLEAFEDKIEGNLEILRHIGSID